VTNVQAGYAATISAREDAYTMTTAERYAIDTIGQQTTTPQGHFLQYTGSKTLLTLNRDRKRQTSSKHGPRSEVLLAVANSAQEEDHCSKAAPPRELDHHSLWPVHCCLESPNTLLLTNTRSDIRLRTQVDVDACVLMSANIAASSHSPREHSPSLCPCTFVETAGSSHKTDYPNQVPASSIT
jgi:hypothetical protein